MLECIFTIDYEIYGNGEGSLRELVYDPADLLRDVFARSGVPFVVFVEAAELEKIEHSGADEAIQDVRAQIRKLQEEGNEIGLHLHPQWCNARYENDGWTLDYSEYNLCNLSRDRMDRIVSRSIAYLRDVLQNPSFTPLSFRAGNWLLQPTETVAAVLSAHGIKIDSSVFKGGVLRNYSLDYRPALNNGYYWPFTEDVNRSAPDGLLLEIPTFTQMVPFWKMFTAKRVALQRKSTASTGRTAQKYSRLLDYLRFRYPLKFDFCRMSLAELMAMVDKVIQEDLMHPDVYRPLVAIGHTKDLVDVETVGAFLSYLAERGVSVTTFENIYKSSRLGT